MHGFQFVSKKKLSLSIGLLCCFSQSVYALEPTAVASDINNAETNNMSAPQHEVRVIYLPERERQRIKEEIKQEMKQEMLATAKQESWIKPVEIPDWLDRISFEGDLRVRYQGDYYDDKNNPIQINYQDINSGAPYDVTGNSGLPPIVNTTENRQRMRIRARLGMNAVLADNLSAHMRLATGGLTSAGSSNQTLGSDFNKVNFSLDRAFFDYKPIEGANILLGRMASPWFSTDLVWDDDINFDGMAAKYKFELNDVLTPFVTVGAFSVENTAVDLPTYSVDKASSRDKWLFAAQVGTDWKIRDDINFRGAIAYYDFKDIQGESSSACQAYTTNIPCDTDSSRPGYLQQGNTLFTLRNLSLPSAPEGPQYQYFGLASPFQELNATAKLDFSFDNNNQLIITADYVKNLGFRQNKMNSYLNAGRLATNVMTDSAGKPIKYDGGDTGYLFHVQYGVDKPALFGQWNIGAGYRYVESDAVLDAFTDSDFHVGGTNAKGFFVGGNVGITKNASLGLRYLSANEISGAPYSVDTIQLDLNGRF
ncbi:hypothetical protein MWMV2_MWMV2_00025 [Acinetobacter oleivorans]|nr:hypothetical protein MWMV12_MWMV12_00025 [Acinetobacter oleivorans]CAI3099656.1 hypothetical protein MWMV3_MWMV3_00025 [Acinetobacter oleivorans]CAI3099662.1 hypothetical protein MWMV19_MWMV19_00025 [Acinetobacter oleivorans]CAI3099690.1 hypothetical protein MWMV2_MWMV2_00025 [Acinetobacter oleivorans]CAI3118839.1 hypothetical protein MWMV5_MWMV5_01101 [Acinetobacter oleivorans]